MNCHQCGGIVIVGDRFCGECGVSIIIDGSPHQFNYSCQQCGSPIDPLDSEASCAAPNGDLYCLECGFSQVPLETETLELRPAPTLAGASDRGRQHDRNEDAIALKVVEQQTYILVVCDGVSSSQHPELASQAAASACARELALAIEQESDPIDSIDRGVAAALVAVSQISFDPDLPEEDSSSTTIVTAIVQDRTISIGWMGDSRAYWIAKDKSYQLTEDDSWIDEAIATGEITPAEAATSPYAHAITRWLGADTLDDDKPNLTTFTMPGAGYLLLCTDGLWNYAPDPTYLYYLTQQAASNNPLDIARHLIRYANQQGGRDNITVGILASREQ
jgi:PPM family protein phosphatase